MLHKNQQSQKQNEWCIKMMFCIPFSFETNFILFYRKNHKSHRVF